METNITSVSKFWRQNVQAMDYRYSNNTSKYDDFFGQFSISFYASLESAIKVNKMTGSSVPDGLLVSQPKDIEYAMKSFLQV